MLVIGVIMIARVAALNTQVSDIDYRMEWREIYE